MKCGRIRQDGRDGFADFCLEDGRGRLKVKQAFRRPLFYRLCGTRKNSGLRLFQADGEQAAQGVAQADFVGLHESGAADSAFKNAACAEILLRLPQDLPPHDAVQNVQLQRRGVPFAAETDKNAAAPAFEQFARAVEKQAVERALRFGLPPALV